VGRVAGLALIAGMWLYALTILLPIRIVRRRAVPRARPPGGLGIRFSREGPLPKASASPIGEAVFDTVAHDYERWVGPFADPIFAEAMAAIGDDLARGSRVLDVGCGPGTALRRVARVLDEGEVVGVDLSLEMLRVAHERVRAARLSNVALYQADVARLPASFEGAFDLAYSCLVHHHIVDQLAAVRSIARALRPGGAYAAIDATGRWLTTLATPLTKAADPGWIAFPSREDLIAVLASAGLARVRWLPLAPGIGMAIGWRDGASV
jgi:ubiquinone/menaquinone biosynthesis C-methylase UbiE